MPTIITRGAVSAKAYGFGVSGGYSVGKSLRFRSSASAYLNRTLGTSTNGQKFTWSGWVKRGKLGSVQGLQHGYSASNNQGGILFNSSDILQFSDYPTSSNALLQTTAVYRDPSAWYHIVVAADTTQATASNRVLMYVNGVQITSFSTATYPTQNTVLNINKTSNTGLIGQYYDGTNNYFDGYLAEVNMVDGQALTPSSFGAYDTNGVWQPIKYSGTYGTNGFYLNFGNTTSTTTLGYDTSGNSNNWTTNNISLTAGSTYDSMTDSPTVTSASVANYAVLNPIFNPNGTVVTYSNANLNYSYSTPTGVANKAPVQGSIAVNSGKWYYEFTEGSPVNAQVGITTGVLYGGSANGPNYVLMSNGGWNTTSGSTPANPSTWTTGAVIGVAFNLTNQTVQFFINGTSQGTITGITSGLTWYPIISVNTSASGGAGSVNFGQQPFTYTPPTGFNALNTYNLPTPTIANGAQYMADTTYTGTGVTQNVLNSANNTIGTTFQPDLVWYKNRSYSSGASHRLFDVSRGTNALYSNLTNAEANESAYYSGTISNGFTVTGNDQSSNFSGSTFVGWQWKAGGSTVSNTNGSITSTVSANTTAGFSVVTYTAPSSGSATVGHGLGVAPSLVIMKTRAYVLDWYVYHQSLGGTQYLILDGTAAAATSSVVWNNTNPTSTVFSLGAGLATTGNMVAYCWAAVAGYSAFGSYTGNGSTDGTFVYLGFRPRFIMFKRTDATSNWLIIDSSRGPYNPDQNRLFPNLSAAEDTSENYDLLSNGFKLRDASGLANNGTIIYAAFAENPFNSSRAR